MSKSWKSPTKEKNICQVTFSNKVQHRCRFCGFMITHGQMTSTKLDNGCSRCRNSLANFEIMETEEED